MFDKKFDKLPKKITSSVGSIASLVVHTVLFIGIFALKFLGFSFEEILLILTTIVSLEAIYLSIFIQISVNKQLQDFKEVSKGIDEIQDSVDDMQKDVNEIAENVE